MKYTVHLFLFSILAFLYQSGSIYDIAVNNIDGQSIDLGSLRGKKIMIVVLPGLEADNIMTVEKLTAFANKYAESLSIIGVPAEEWGYNPGNKSQLKSLYSSLPGNFILSDGMKVKKIAAEIQTPLFQWLTDKNKNGFNDREVPSIGEKYFIDEKGTLYGVMGASLGLDNSLIDRIISRKKLAQQ